MAHIVVRSSEAEQLLEYASQFWRDPSGMMKVAGQAMLADTQAFYSEKHSAFWERIGTAWKENSSDNTARISLLGEQAAILIHKRDGGMVYPGAPPKNLAIPATELAKRAGWPSWGKTPPLVPGWWGRDGRPHALVEDDNPNRKPKKEKPAKPSKEKKRRKSGKPIMDIKDPRPVWYILARQAKHKPDPAAMPDPKRTLDAVKKILLDEVAKVY